MMEYRYRGGDIIVKSEIPLDSSVYIAVKKPVLITDKPASKPVKKTVKKA